MNNIDIDFDFREDSRCGDPDSDSIKLYELHQLLWSKQLPNGKNFDLQVLSNNKSRLLLKNDFCDNLSSDRMCPHFCGGYNGKFDGWLTDLEEAELQKVVRTIGGHIVFPANRKNGFTINQARGISSKIRDRFDLTLECIRRYYQKEESPLYDTLFRYSDFLDLFVDFKGYVDFFLLQDFVDDKGQILFLLPFDNFKRPALPQNADEYKAYQSHTILLITSGI